MTEIYSWITVSLLLSGIGMILAFRKALRSRKKLLGSVPYDKKIETQQGEVEAKSYYSNISIVMASLSMTSFLYTILISILILIFGIPNAVLHRIAIGSLFAVSISSFFTNAGRYLVYDEAILGMNEFGEGSSENFGKHMVFLVIFETTSIYGLLIAQLGLVLSGIMAETTQVNGFELAMSDANMFLIAGIIVGVSGIANILSARSFNRVEGPVNKREDLFVEKLKALVIPHAINILGLVAAVVLMLQSGLIG